MTPPPDAAVARFRGDLAALLPSPSGEGPGAGRSPRAHGGGFPHPNPSPKGEGLSRDAGFALAVSGGPDSMAMLALAAAALPGRVVAATFDHRLRPASADEARMVADACAALGVPHTILTPAAPIAGSSLQMRARAARYAALLDWSGGTPLLTAHHADDQAETLLMRLNRGSGVAGLAGVRAVRWEGATPILRPLLAWRRAALRAIVEGCGVPFVDDPSNDDPRYDRTRVRALLAATPDLDPVMLARAAGYIAEAEETFRQLAERIHAERWHGPGRAYAVAEESRELRRRLIRRAIADTRAVLGIVLPAFGDSANVEPLLDALEQGRGAVQGGVAVAPGRDGWTLRAAPPRRSD